jgi:hypothetical protein
MKRSQIFAALACMIPIGLVYLFPHADYAVFTPSGTGTQYGFLPRWQLEAAYGRSTGLFLIMMVNVLMSSAAVVYYFGGPRLVDDESRGAKLTRNLGILYLLLGLPWVALGAGIYGSPLADSPSKPLLAAWVGLATGPLLVLPARYLFRQRRLRGLVLVAGGCLSAPLLAYGINQISDLLFPFLLVITLPMVALGWYQLLRSGGQLDEIILERPHRQRGGG